MLKLYGGDCVICHCWVLLRSDSQPVDQYVLSCWFLDIGYCLYICVRVRVCVCQLDFYSQNVCVCVDNFNCELNIVQLGRCRYY